MVRRHHRARKILICYLYVSDYDSDIKEVTIDMYNGWLESDEFNGQVYLDGGPPIIKSSLSGIELFLEA